MCYIIINKGERWKKKKLKKYSKKLDKSPTPCYNKVRKTKTTTVWQDGQQKESEVSTMTTRFYDDEMFFDDDVNFDDFSFEDDDEMFFDDDDADFFEDDDNFSIYSFGEEQFKNKYGIYFDDIVNPFEDYSFSREDLIALVAMSKLDGCLNVSLKAHYDEEHEWFAVNFTIRYCGDVLYDETFDGLDSYELCSLYASCGTYPSELDAAFCYDEWVDEEDAVKLEALEDYASRLNIAA